MVEKAAQETVISAKEEILNRIRGALGTAKSERESDYAYIPRQYHVAGTRSEADRLTLFVDRLHDYAQA